MLEKESTQLSEIKPTVAPGIIRFDSVKSLKRYLKRLLDLYQMEVDSYGETVAEFMRDILQREKEQMVAAENNTKQNSVTWQKMGWLLVEMTDPLVGKNDVMLLALEESKAKLSRTSNALKSFEELAQYQVPENIYAVLYLRGGVPERIIFDTSAQRELLRKEVYSQLLEEEVLERE